MSHAYHNVWHVTDSDGRIISRHETNDDNDDGWPDGEVTRYSIGPQPKERALQSPYDRSHIGISGVYVYVYLDGKEIT
jgi:hypothetical protein